MVSERGCDAPVRRGCTETAWVTAVVMIAAASVSAGTIYVDGQIGSSSCSSYAPATRSCSGGTARCHQTPAGAAAAAMPGDTVLIRGGTYGEALKPGRSGTESAPITYSAYPGETPIITGAFAPAIDVSGKSWLVIEGLTVRKVNGWFRADGSHHNVLRNNRFEVALSTGTTGGVKFVGSDRNRIIGNTIEDGNDNLLLIDSDYNLVEDNVIRRGRHALWGIKCGNFNVIRNNYFENEIQKIGEVFDCAGVPSDAPIQYDATKRNVIEQNIFARTRATDAPHRYNGIQYSAQHGIIRQNVFYENDGGALGMSLYADEALHNTHNRVYHNVFHDNNCMGVRLSQNSAGEILDNLFVNNIFFSNHGCTSGAIQISMKALSDFGFHHNDILCTQAGENVIANDAGTTSTLHWWQQNQPSHFHDNQEVDPQFRDAAGRDFTPAEGSPMIDAGAFLTRTTSAGSGTVVAVEDAGWFCDGFGIAGVEGDLVQFEHLPRAVRVVSIDYATNRITLSEPLTWAAGQGLALAYSGAGPDVGAIETAVVLPPAAPDLDEDGDIDAADLELFTACASGPGVPIAAACGSMDFDGDGDIDQEDFSILQRCWSGAGNATSGCE